MVRHEDGSLGYRHELVRRAIEGSLSQPRLQRLHEKVLEILEARGNIPAARLVHHASCAQDADALRRFAPLAAARPRLSERIEKLSIPFRSDDAVCRSDRSG